MGATRRAGDGYANRVAAAAAAAAAAEVACEPRSLLVTAEDTAGKEGEDAGDGGVDTGSGGGGGKEPAQAQGGKGRAGDWSRGSSSLAQWLRWDTRRAPMGSAQSSEPSRELR